MPEYFLILSGIFLLTLLLHKYFEIKLYKSFQHFLVFNSLNLFLAAVWDQIAIRRGHWKFGQEFLLGPKIGYMPLEEFFFVLVVSYFALVLYKIVEEKV